MANRVSTKNPVTLPSLSNIPNGIDPALKGYLESLAEAVDSQLGRRGDPKDRAVTVRELIDAGLADELVTNSGSLGRRRVTVKPTTRFADQTIPPAPTGFTVTAGYSVIQLYWDFPLYGSHSQTEIWRFDSDTIGDAILVGVSGGRSFIDPVGGDQTYYYWIRHVSEAGIPGPYNATAGTVGTTAPDVSVLLDVLTDSISASQLTEGLLEMIDGAGSAIDLAALQTFVGYDAGYTGDPLLDLITANEALLDAIDTYTGYDAGYAGAPLLTRITTAEAAITALQTTVNHGTTGVAATASALTALTTRVTTAEGTISTQGTAITTNSTAITALQTAVNHPSTGLAAANTAISALQSTVTSQGSTISAHTSDITTLQSTVNNGSTGVAATAAAVSALGTRVTTAENNITSQGSAITALQSTVNNGSTGVVATATALSALTTTVTSQGTSISTLSGQYTSLNTTVGGHTTTISSHTASINGLSAEYMVKINANGRVSGFGLYGGATSEFIILADRFAIVSQHNNSVTGVPFIVQATSTTVGGVSVPAGIYVNDAFIMNGTIVNAKIANAAIDDAKIANLSANKITTGTLDTSRLNIDGSTLISEDGVLKVGDIDAGNITAESITTDKLVANGINEINVISTTTGGSMTGFGPSVILDGEIVKTSGTEGTVIVDVQFDVLRITGSGAYVATWYVVLDGGPTGRTFQHLLDPGFTHTIGGRSIFQGVVAGTYTVQLWAGCSVGAVVQPTDIDMIVTEVKR